MEIFLKIYLAPECLLGAVVHPELTHNLPSSAVSGCV